MLVLTRRTGEALKIGDDITITVLGCQGNQIKIGIDAPRDVEVHREEVYKRVFNISSDNVTPFIKAKKQRRSKHGRKDRETVTV